MPTTNKDGSGNATIVSLPPATPSSSSNAPGISSPEKQNQHLHPSHYHVVLETLALLKDPIECLNRHYKTETSLANHVVPLQQMVQERIVQQDERISTALQRQAETSQHTVRHLMDAQSSIQQLEQRIRLVQSKAHQSEQAVLEITRDMKRLDCAKRHLQTTITTLKRLHMLVHAIEELRLACLDQPFANYTKASGLLDATHLLLQHFQSHKVAPLKRLEHKLTSLKQELYDGILQGFRIVSFGMTKALELQQETKKKGSKRGKTPKESPKEKTTGTDAADQDAEASPAEETSQPPPPLTMTPNVMRDGTVFMDALGLQSRMKFLTRLCLDHLQPYQEFFAPVPPTPPPSKKHSFKLKETVVEEHQQKPHVLEQVERRFAWYRRTIREVESKFPQVFPIHWNFFYHMTRVFLEKTKSHFLDLLRDGPKKDRERKNATILLKALQKSILFEKEMMALLQRDFETIFIVSKDGEDDNNNAARLNPLDRTYDDEEDDDERLEFDDSGRAVAANSAQGIRIKYERQKRARLQKEQSDENKNNNLGLPPLVSKEPVPVESLLGVASTAFDNYMGPYIELEEQSMDEQLVASLSDTAVDSRGDLPVFTSSTTLFVYIKGSITRCTAMSKSKTFFQLYQAFQDSLQKYAQVLVGKLPTPTPTASSSMTAGLNLSSLSGKQNTSSSTSSSSQQNQQQQQKQSSVTVVIPPEGEVSICHVISTCEYCVDTIEALEDLIRDTIEADYKERIDMNLAQESFHDVTAKSLTTLVSGLMNRCEAVLKDEMSSTNWSQVDMVGDESPYVLKITQQVEPFCATVRALVPSSYFRSFCDKFAMKFTSTYYNTLIRLKRMSEQGSQQLLLDVNNLKTVMMKLPVVEPKRGTSASSSSAFPKTVATTTTIAPAMYTKMVTKQFKRIETTLKLVGTPVELLMDVFRMQWPGGSALDLQTVMSLKGLKRSEQAVVLEQMFGIDPVTARAAAAAGTGGGDLLDMGALRQQGTHVAQKVNSDLSQMRQKVDDFRKAFR